METKKKKSPLKATPLRNPGQSLDEQITDLWDDAVQYFIFIMGFFSLTIYDWVRWFGFAPKNPYLSTILSLIVIVYSIIKILRLKKQMEPLKLGRDGEKIVGQYLDELKGDGARVLHDIIGDGFNIDHVIISEHGIFVVDTKTYQKPAKGEAIISVKDDNIFVNNVLITRNPITQGKALARWLQELLEKSTGRKYPVQPVVVFPGWFVEKMRGNQDVWVLNPKALPTFIKNNRQEISQEDIHLVFYHLARYVRSL